MHTIFKKLCKSYISIIRENHSAYVEQISNAKTYTGNIRILKKPKSSLEYQHVLIGFPSMSLEDYLHDAKWSMTALYWL